MWKISEKRPFFRADMAGLGKYHTGGYGRIGVYRVILLLISEKWGYIAHGVCITHIALGAKKYGIMYKRL